MSREILFEEIEKILKGIDEEETDSADGWWETSVGAKFGRIKLLEIKSLLQNYDIKYLGNKPRGGKYELIKNTLTALAQLPMRRRKRNPVARGND